MKNTEEKVIYIGLKLNKRTDADILAVIGEGHNRQIALRSLIRKGIKIGCGK